MTYVKCAGCGEIIEIPDELLASDLIDLGVDDITDALGEPYYCDACEWKKPEDDILFCREHQCPTHLTDYEEGSRYECPECQRERGEALGLR